MQMQEGIVKNLKFLGQEGQPLPAGKSGKVPPGQLNTPGNQAEAFRYFYHPDHLGSTSYITDASGEVYQHLEYFAFGETFVEEHSNTNRTPYLYNGKELDEETGLYYYGARYYDARTSVFPSVDPLTENYPFQSGYVYAGNNPVRYVDIQGMGPGDGSNQGIRIYVFDQKNNPNNKRVYTAQIFVQLQDGTVSGPFRGSSFPNAPDSKNIHKTVDEGTFKFNNKLGHKGGSTKGLNMVDSNGNRKTPATTTPGGIPATAVYVNIHSGQVENASGQHNRGSEACITLHPEDAEAFFNNFDWSGSLNRYDADGNLVTYKGTSGTSSGEVSIFRGVSTKSSIYRNRLEKRLQMQEFLKEISIELPLIQSDATRYEIIKPIIEE
jgi:RHS repeat-associated protein